MERIERKHKITYKNGEEEKIQSKIGTQILLGQRM